MRVFIFQKYAKLWSILLGRFIKHKHLISDEWKWYSLLVSVKSAVFILIFQLKTMTFHCNDMQENLFQNVKPPPQTQQFENLNEGALLETYIRHSHRNITWRMYLIHSKKSVLQFVRNCKNSAICSQIPMPLIFIYLVLDTPTTRPLFRKKKFMLDEMFQQNASIFAIYLEYQKPT